MAGPLAITGRSAFGRSRWGKRGWVAMSGDTETATQTYMKNAVKLIPGEIMALYAGAKIIPSPASWPDLHLAPVACAALLILIRLWATGQVWAMLISLGTFIIWVYAQGDWFVVWKLNDVGHYIAQIAVLAIGFLPPFFVGKKA